MLAVAKLQTHTCTFKPLPLNKKENTESNEVNQILEVKTADSKAIDSESENQAESVKVLDFGKVDSESKRLANRDISSFRPQYDKDSESMGRAESAMVGDSEKLETAIDSESAPSLTCEQAIHKTRF